MFEVFCIQFCEYGLIIGVFSLLCSGWFMLLYLQCSVLYTVFLYGLKMAIFSFQFCSKYSFLSAESCLLCSVYNFWVWNYVCYSVYSFVSMESKLAYLVFSFVSLKLYGCVLYTVLWLWSHIVMFCIYFVSMKLFFLSSVYGCVILE